MIDPAQRHLILVGGGHSHALVLAAFATQGKPDLRLTLISPARYSLYSGMVPGVIAGQYQLREAQIDVATLAERVGASFVQAAALRVDAQRRMLELSDRSRLPYDLVSFDIGTQPKLTTLVRARAHHSARPVERRLRNRGSARRAAAAGRRRSSAPALPERKS
jgi:selenide,water dikinase